MDGAGDKLLARAGLAADENRGLEFRDLPYRPKEIQHLLTARHQVAEPSLGLLATGTNLFVQGLVLAKQPFALLGLAQKKNDLVGLEGLGDVVVGAAFHGLNGDVAAAIGGHHDHRGAKVALPDFVDQIHAALSRHAQIRDDDVVRSVGEFSQCPLDRRHPNGLIAFALEQCLQHMPQSSARHPRLAHDAWVPKVGARPLKTDARPELPS